ncbi:MAG: ribonuclease III [Clostridia bacterium]|nr:ribonuclease III [Clostridia bacterium]
MARGKTNQFARLQKKIGIEFQNLELLEQALTHPSYAVDNKCADNQRLEFLGDAVLQLCASQALYQMYPESHEGQLTRRRSAAVCEANLAKAANRLSLGDWLRLGHGEEVLGGRKRASILADAMEAVIAAVYLDAGFEEAKQFIDRALNGYKAAEVDLRDAKSRLQELMQTDGGAAPQYEIIAEDGPANARVFTARVLNKDNVELGRGQGTRKQWAEEAAAEEALKQLEKAKKKRKAKVKQAPDSEESAE